MIDASVADIARRQARERPDEVALWFEGRRTTFAELDERASRCAQALLAEGVKPGERVGVLARGNDDFFVLWFGCLKIGACLIPVNWRLAPPEMAFILGDAGVGVLACGSDYAETVAQIRPDCPAIRRIIQFEPGHPDWPAFGDWIGAHPAVDPHRSVEPDDDVIQIYTSGTTGLPKGVQLTEANFVALMESASTEWAHYDPGDAVLIAMPLFHVAGANVAMLVLYQGARAVVMREADPARIIDLVQEHRVRQLLLVPALINMVLQHPASVDADFTCVDNVYYGASPISEEVLLRAQARFNAGFTQLYGLTETSGMAANLSPKAHAEGRLRACGRPSVGCELRVWAEDRLAQTMEVGEVQIRGGAVMKGYWNRPDATAEAIDADGWFKSGDAGYLDAEGYLFIHDRVKDMIVSGGENVYPAEVENALFSHPAVADAAVIGVPDERWGEAVKAVLVLRPGAEAGPAEIIAHCRERIAGYKIPKSVDFVAVLPRNPSGKVLRRELRKPYWEGRGRLVG